MCGLIARVRVVSRRTVVGDIDRRFDNLSGSLTLMMTSDSDDDFRSGCRNVGQCHQQQSFSGLLSPGRSNYTNDYDIIEQKKVEHARLSFAPRGL